MKQNLLVSVIIPVFNVRPYLAEALDSVVHQTYEKLEIIIIDDGSTDGSDRICDEYAARDPRIRVIHQKNEGLSSARNAGLEIMKGELTAFLDADDAWHPGFVSSMAEAMRQSDADMVICRRCTQHTTGRLSFDSRENVFPTIEQGVYGRIGALRAYADGQINAGVWNKLYKRKLWEKERFPEGHLYEDFYTAYRIIDHCERVCVIGDVLYAYRRRPGSITDRPTKQSLSDLFLAYSCFDAYAKERVPEVFPQQTITKLEQSRMNQKITYYASLSGTKDPELKRYAEELRRQVIDSGKNGKVREYGLSTQACYRIMCMCPRLLGAFTPIPGTIRTFVKRVIRKQKHRSI